MPPGPQPQPDTDILQVSVDGTLLDAKWTNVLWFQLTGVININQADIDALTLAVGQAWANAFKNHLSNDWNVVQARGRQVQSGGTELGSIQAVGIHGSSGVGSDLAASTACAISWLAGVSWRGGRPRSYLCGFHQADLASGSTRLFAASSIANIKADAQAFLAAANAISHGGATLTFGFLHRQQLGGWIEPNPIFYPIQDARVNTRVDSQRRRLGR